MARPDVSARRAAVSRNKVITAAASVHRPGRKSNPNTDRHSIAKSWQIEAYRQVNICGEARYAATLFSNIAGRTEIGVSEPNAMIRKAVWVTSGAEVDAFAELAPTVRDRTKLVRDFMIHRVIAGECYLIARDRLDIDPEFESRRNEPVWEIVAVTEIQRVGESWRVRHENGTWLDLRNGDPVIRMWNPDPEDRMEAWSPFRSLMSTLHEIEWLTRHIFTQVRSRLSSAGVWFLPDNLTFPAPPPDAVEGGADAIAAMNEAEQFLLSLASSSMDMLDHDEVALPSIVMADPVALANVNQSKLIQFWSEIDDKAMHLRSDAVRRFALGMDLPPEQVLGSSGLAVTGAGGSAGSVNHWGVWANEEQTISAHIEPAMDDFVNILTTAFLRNAVEGTDKVIGYDTATLRLRQDRSEESIELYDRGLLSGKVALRENGFDAELDMMDDAEFRRWLLTKIAGGSATPEQVQESLRLLGVVLSIAPEPVGGPAKELAPKQPGRNEPPSLDDHPYEGPPRVDHENKKAPFSDLGCSEESLLDRSEGLVLRALEKAGNRLLNSGRRGREKDMSTPVHMAHVMIRPDVPLGASEFDFSLASAVFSDLSAMNRARVEARLGRFCLELYENAVPYSREGLKTVLRGL